MRGWKTILVLAMTLLVSACSSARFGPKGDVTGGKIYDLTAKDLAFLRISNAVAYLLENRYIKPQEAVGMTRWLYSRVTTVTRSELEADVSYDYKAGVGLRIDRMALGAIQDEIRNDPYGIVAQARTYQAELGNPLLHPELVPPKSPRQ